MGSGSPRNFDLDPVVAQVLNLNEKQEITFNIKLKNHESSSIYLEPETPSDWELVELHAGVLENVLISQARAAAVGQKIVVFPSKTSSAKLIITSIGSEDHSFVKINPFAEIAVAPKEREKRASSVSGRSNRSSRSGKRSTEDYSNLPSVLKRAISLPHNLFDRLPPSSNPDGYEIYANLNDFPPAFRKADYVATSIIAGPDQKYNSVTPSQSQSQTQSQPQTQTQSNDQDKSFVPIKENKRVVAKIIDCKDCLPNSIGVSYKLAVALNTEFKTGYMALLKPAVKSVPKRPSTLIVHPYITQTKKNNQISLNSSEKKDQETKLAQQLSDFLYNKVSPMSLSPITNYIKLPIIPHLLPNGGLLKFKRSDDVNAWIKPYDLENKKPPKFEVGEDLLRNASFIEESQSNSDDDIGSAIGMDIIINEIVQSISTFRNSGTLVHGNLGSGKSLLLRIIGKELNSKYGYHTKFVSCESIMNENFNMLSSNHFTKWFQECSWHKPSLLILDNLDKILSAEVEHADSTNSKQLTEFFISQLLRIQSQNNSNVSIIVSGISKESFNAFLFQSHLVENFHHLRAPDKGTRAEILNTYIQKSLGCTIDFDIMDMVSETEGYLPNDLKILCERMYHESIFNSAAEKGSESIKSITKNIFEKAFEGYTPSNLRGVKLQKSSINWTDIGGLKEAKNMMLETLEWPTKYAPIFANCPLRLRSGILLYGYPGCGKTLLASAIAGQCGLNFISIKGPEILNKYIGASEQSVRDLFERAQSAKPCILFFDEFDSIAPKRGHDSTGVTDRVVNQMLTQMDGAEGLDGVYVLAATSRPDLIDSALLRPGRLDKSVICDMPNYEDRLDILKTITDKMSLNDDVNLEEIAKNTSGFSGADMQGLGYNAYLKAVHVKLLNDEKHALKGENNSSDKKTYEFFQVNPEKFKNTKLRPADRVKMVQQIEQVFAGDQTNNGSHKASDSSNSNDTSLIVRICHADFLESLKETKPSISVTEKQKLERIYSQFVSGRDGNMPDGSASNDIGGRTTLM